MHEKILISMNTHCDAPSYVQLFRMFLLTIHMDTFFKPNIDKKNKLVQTALIEYSISYRKWLLNNLYAYFSL